MLFLARLEEVLCRLSDFGLQLKAKKCTFMQTEVDFLGHIVGRTGLACDPEKISAVRNWHAPSSVKGVRQFVGFIGYLSPVRLGLCGFIGASGGLNPEGVPFVWTDRQQAAFEALKTWASPQRTDSLMQELCLLCGAHKTPYHPTSDGLVERFDKTLLMMLAMFAGENRVDWDDLLPAVMMAYCSSVHESTGFSPYRLMFGEECNCLWMSASHVRIRTYRTLLKTPML